MSKLSNLSKEAYIADKNTVELRLDETVKNYMNGDSYTVNPLDTLKMVSASSIFGEPSYYRGSKASKSVTLRSVAKIASRESSDYEKDLRDNAVFETGRGLEVDTTELMENVIDAALDFDFEGTLKWAVELRNTYYMRLNPQVILVRAAMHPNRQSFTKSQPEGAFRIYANQILVRADDCLSGMAYYIYKTGGKSNMPSVLKRSYADKLSGLSEYQVNKYKNAEIGMINGVRICHANSPVISELMSTGKVEVGANQSTWETMRSAGSTWTEIFNTLDMGHMALLRNLRGFFEEVSDNQLRSRYLDKLINGVKNGKQFAFRYYSAYNAINDCEFSGKQSVLDALEVCMDKSIENMPHIKGNTVVLSDNSGSAWGMINSEYGSVKVAEIDNLSAVITAACSDQGKVIIFGDNKIEFEISHRNGILKQANEINEIGKSRIGGATEGGIWEFFDQAIRESEVYDTIFIYSDMQAGTGDLYGTEEQRKVYSQNFGVQKRSGWAMINVFKLLLEYRAKVNKRVNVFSVQTAGYNNNILPEYAYRTNLMFGWTGKEPLFADIVSKQWDAIDARKQQS